ncbi:MAG: FKBP-type peptidyl-prolyl cis-trans isomerase [Proteobacteria bacterium]|nr:FKBP-type peptidyl-prolyl cis-trans isomerase [Pseudomonadota bacterium]
MDKKYFFGKRYFVLVIFTFISLSVFAATEIKTEKQKLSYTMGIYFALGVTQQEMDIDVPSFIQAVEDALKGKEPQISTKEMQDILTRYKETIAKQQSDAVAANRKVGNIFLAENKKKKGVIESPTGLQYKVIKEGEGEKPVASSNVTVHYKGALIDGTVFDSSYERGQPATLSLSQVIKGWQEALPMMKAGSKWQIYVPSELAYGDHSASQLIGPASTLIFDIELISVN